MRIYDDEGTFTGEMVDGVFTPVAPVPSGDAFDDMWDLCCATFEKHPRLRSRLDSWFLPNSETGRHTTWLGDEVVVWIRQGNLRSYTQVNEAVTAYANHWDRLVRLGVLNKWVIDLATVKSFRWFFAVAGAKPLPSKDEYIAEQKEWEAREAERQRQAANASRANKAEMEVYEKELARDERITNLLQALAAKLWSMEDIDLDAEPLPPEYEDRRRKRSVFCKCSRDVITEMVDAGLSDSEIVEKTIMDYVDTLVEMGRSGVPPLKEGETRRFFTKSEFHKFLVSEWDTVLSEGNETSLMLGMDGLFVVTIRPQGPEAEQAALAAAQSKSNS